MNKVADESITTKESERVSVHETRGNDSGPLRFKRVEIKYSDGDLFYSGWIQDFGDTRTGPTFFEQNYKNFGLERERVFKREKYWPPFDYSEKKTAIRDASREDLDDLIDLTFQNYFDGGYNRISAYQGLNHKVDSDHITLGFTVDNTIFAYLFIDLVTHASQKEAYFDSLFCAPAVRRTGVGNKLLAAGLDRVKRMGFERVSGKVIGDFAHCRQIIRMLSAHGFTVVEHSENGPDWFDVTVLKAFSNESKC